MRFERLLRDVVVLLAVLLFAGTHAYADDFDFSDDDTEMNFDEPKDGEGGENFDFDFDGGGEGGEETGGGVSEAVPLEAHAVDEASPTYKTFQEALTYSQQEKHQQASLLYYQVLKAEDETGLGLRARATYELGRTLFQLGLPQSALTQFEKILSVGPANEFFAPTLQWLVLIAREMPGEPQRANRILVNFETLFPEQIEPALLADVGLLMGQAAYANGTLDDVPDFLGHVDPSSPLYPKARFIEGVTYVRQFNGQLALEQFKNILRYVSEQPDPTDDQLRMQELAVASLARVFYQVGHNLWMDGDRQKAVQSWNTAIKYYATFGQSSENWLDSLFEASWTYYRVDNFNKALGLLHTLNSPFFNDEYYPEAMLLQAQIYYTNCHYDRVMYILEEYKSLYPPLRDALEAELTNLIQPQDVYGFLKRTTDGSGAFDPTTKQVLNAALKDRELKRIMAYIASMDAEVDRIRNADAGWARHELATSLVQDIEFTKDFAMAAAGTKAKARLERVVDELGTLNNKALDIEIETTEAFAERAEQQGLDPAALQAFEREINEIMAADDEHLFWTFDGEYWRDELGYYWYHITSRCGR